MEKIRCGNFIVKLAETETEYKQLYKLRYFDLLLHYNHDLKKDIEEDKDEYDEYCDHLIVIDLENNEVIASYRLIKKNHLNKKNHLVLFFVFLTKQIINYYVL